LNPFPSLTFSRRDYTAVPELDRYDPEDLASDQEEDEMGYLERRKVTDLLNQRDRERRTTREDRIDELADYEVQDDVAARHGVFHTHYGTVGDDREIDDEEDEQEVEYRELEVNLEVCPPSSCLVLSETQIVIGL
jgi:hypothetical protein